MEEYEPFLSHYFSVEIDNDNVSFQEVSGLDGSIELETINEGGCTFSHRLPVRINYGNLRLVKGVFREEKSSFLEWINSFWPIDNLASANIKNTKDVTISLLGAKDAEPQCTWYVQNAYPVKWSGPKFNALENALALESLELAFQRISLTSET